MMSPLPKVDKHLMRGAATALVLLVLRDKPSHGYELVEEIRRRSKDVFDFGEGTIYPLLYGLEKEGVIRGKWETVTGARRRRVYQLTATGQKHLEVRLAAWDRYQKGMRIALQQR